MAKKSIPTELKSLSAGERKEINDFIKSQGLTGVARTQAQIMLARQAIIEREKRIRNLARAFKKSQVSVGKGGKRKRKKSYRTGMVVNGKYVKPGSKAWNEAAAKYSIPTWEQQPKPFEGKLTEAQRSKILQEATGG